MKRILLALALGAISSGSNAALLSVDWQSPGDNLLTQDTVSGLQWLDLTVTYGLTHDFVSGQLGAGGQFEGFRYATDAEVQDLWSNFGIDLSAGAPTVVAGSDPGVETAAGLLGNTWCTYACFDYPFGVSGLTSTASGMGHYAMGAYQTDFGFTQYETVGSQIVADALTNIQPYGSYLVLGSPVPVPAALWLFGSGLGLFGFFAKSKSRHD